MFVLMGFETNSIKMWSSNSPNQFKTKVMPDQIENKSSERLKHVMCPNCNELKGLFMGNNFIQCSQCLDLFITSDELLEVYNKDNYHREIKHGVELNIIEME